MTMNTTETDAAMAYLRDNDAVYRCEAALGQTGVDAAITTAVADWRVCQRRYTAHIMHDGHSSAADGELRAAGGALICLGRLLALKEGLPVEHYVSAFNRGRAYMDSLDAPDTSADQDSQDDDSGEEYAIRPCVCFGEGCNSCDNTGVIYP